MAVILNLNPAAAGGNNNGFSTVFNMRPPDINIGFNKLSGFRTSGQMLADGSAAALTGRADQTDPQLIQYPADGFIGIGCSNGLSTAFQDQHLVCMLLNSALSRCLFNRQLVF